MDRKKRIIKNMYLYPSGTLCVGREEKLNIATGKTNRKLLGKRFGYLFFFKFKHKFLSRQIFKLNKSSNHVQGF